MRLQYVSVCTQSTRVILRLQPIMQSSNGNAH
uniref:Uncharacterized protein n=1 Tax=Anguilla anguilla TaxID=7936 RepID=A0A0E9S8Y7_ANGAN